MKEIFPLADNLRPASLDDYVGQEQLVGPGRVIRSFIENKRLQSLVFWGPPGTGKTTLSRIIVKEMDLPSVEFSATISKLNDVREVMKKAAETRQMTEKPMVLFVDEIHHFNRSAQDAFLPYMERGDIILLGTTTENPAFKLNRALMSRLKVLEFFPLQTEHLEGILKKGLDYIAEAGDKSLELDDDIQGLLLHTCGGDARRLLNLMEILYHFSVKTEEPLTAEMVQGVIQNKIGSYDRTGDDRYQLISAFHKAVRNSDLDASLFWLYRMLEGGEDPLFILRRMVRITVEDIGLADPEALQICLNAKQAFEFLGQPEGDLFLGQAAVYLASAPKSNALYKMEKQMKKVVEKYKQVGVPLHIINPSHIIAKGQGAGKGYVYAHDFPEKTTAMPTMPESVTESGFYHPTTMGFEKKIKHRIDYWLKIKEKLRGQ